MSWATRREPPLHEVGSEPDNRFSYACERTDQATLQLVAYGTATVAGAGLIIALIPE